MTTLNKGILGVFVTITLFWLVVTIDSVIYHHYEYCEDSMSVFVYVIAYSVLSLLSVLCLSVTNISKSTEVKRCLKLVGLIYVITVFSVFALIAFMNYVLGPVDVSG